MLKFLSVSADNIYKVSCIQEVIFMKIGEARQLYSAKISELNARRDFLYEQKKALEDGKIQMTDDEISALGKAIDRVEISRDNAYKTMEGINVRRKLLYNAESTKRAGETAAKKADDYSKCLEVARRIARGDKVPPKDEKKLLEFSSEMYQMAKTMAAAAQNEKTKKHKSLWKDEDENQAPEKSVDEVVDNMECGSVMPDISADIGAHIE